MQKLEALQQERDEIAEKIKSGELQLSTEIIQNLSKLDDAIEKAKRKIKRQIERNAEKAKLRLTEQILRNEFAAKLKQFRE